MLDLAWSSPRMFSINFTGPQGTRTQTFELGEHAITSDDEWVSTDGHIIVMEGMLGWNAYLYPDWRRVHWWGYRTKELAAFAGVLAKLEAEADNAKAAD